MYESVGNVVMQMRYECVRGSYQAAYEARTGGYEKLASPSHFQVIRYATRNFTPGAILVFTFPVRQSVDTVQSRFIFFTSH